MSDDSAGSNAAARIETERLLLRAFDESDVGEVAFFDGKPRSASVRAVADGEVLVVAEPLLHEVLGTDPGLVWLCLDTGHITYGGGDNIDLIRRFGDRMGYVHLKQLNPEVLRQAREHSLPFIEAVKRGVVVELSAGIPDAAAVIAELDLLGVPMFVIAEQDLYPCSPDIPFPIAVRTREYLNGCGMSAWPGEGVRT